MARPITRLTASRDDRRELEVRADDGDVRAAVVMHRLAGTTVEATALTLGISIPTASKWSRRFKAYGIAGLQDAPRSGRPTKKPKPKLTHRPIELRVAKAFVTEHYRHNKAPTGHRFSIGAFYGDDLVGVVVVGHPVVRMLDDGVTVEVLRCCVKDGAPRNTTSYLYGAVRRIWMAMGGGRVVTYTLESEPGDSLRGAGWRPDGRVRVRLKPWHGPGRDRTFEPIYARRKTRWATTVT